MTIRVLVVDDHPTVREGLRSIIGEQSDMAVIGVAEDGYAAISAAREQAPEVVVMDVSMPGLNGIEATRRIQAELPHVRVLCLSVHADEHLVSEMLEAGASGYVLKDAAPVELVEAVRVVANRQTYLSPSVAGGVVRDYVSHLSADKAREPHLTSREREVLQLIAEGHDTGHIASRLTISPKTVATHREHLMQKLDLHSIAALTKYAIRHGISTAERDTE